LSGPFDVSWPPRHPRLGKPHKSPITEQTASASSPDGLVLNFVKPEKTADFEAIVTRLQEAPQKKEKPERKQQAASWKVFRRSSQERMAACCVFSIDPAVKGADYPPTILAGLPHRVQARKQYAESDATGQLRQPHSGVGARSRASRSGTCRRRAMASGDAVENTDSQDRRWCSTAYSADVIVTETSGGRVFR
jgi:hypothetical protein